MFRPLFILGCASVVLAKVQFMGINIAGFDFGCQIDGTCPQSSIVAPLSSLGGGDGQGQMEHFAQDDGMNIFRIPVSWQFLVNDKQGGALDDANFGKYDQVMQACLATGASCAIDIHNFARWNGQIIGQSATGPTDAQFADFWAQLASKYKDNTKVIFGLMNEPHDVDIAIWAKTVQAAVTAIRNTGATSQMILLPGNNFASAGTFVSNGSGAALLAVTNPDGSTTNLIMDLHKYLDEDNSGTHAECTTDNIADAFALVATFLKENGRLGLVSETGAGSTASCITSFCAQNTFINQNSDVFLGYIAWAAGSFATDYVLSLTPTKTNGKYVDNELAAKCVVAPFRDSTATPASAALPAIASGDYTTRRVTSTRTSYLTVSSVLQTSVTVTTSNSTEQAAATSTVPTLTTSTGASTTAAALGTPLTNGTKGGGVAFSSINLTPTASQPSGTGSAGQALVTGSADRVKAAASLLAGSFFVALFL